jgi:hypothetical protein
VRPYLKRNPSLKRIGGVAQGIDPEFKHKFRRKKKDERGQRQLSVFTKGPRAMKYLGQD